MIGDTLSGMLTDLERYLDHGDLSELTPPRPDPRPFEVEMRIKLDDGNEVAVLEQAATMSDLGSAMERARVRLALTLARVTT